MPKASFCRICLVEEAGICVIKNKNLIDVYEKLTNIKLETNDKAILEACNICHSQLVKCYQLMKRALKSQDILIKIVEVTNNSIKEIDREKNKLIYSLSTAVLRHITIDPNEICGLDNDHVTEKVVEQSFKKEIIDIDKYKDDMEDQIDSWSSDSEDNVPLNTISMKKKLETRLEGKNKVWKRKIKNLTMDAREIFLSKEEQLEEILSRSKTSNYLNSPLKCDICYKGFIDTNAFSNHMEKHDVRSGAHECDVCRMRYQSQRHLRTHLVSAHSRIYKCNRCLHTSHTKNQAREHDKWHRGHTYECQLCSNKFRKSTSYLTHMRTSHPTEYVCNICGRSCLGKHGLIMHKSKMHRGINESPPSEDIKSEAFCNECNVQFINIEAWKRHILTSVKHLIQIDSNPQCKICGEQFTSGTFLTTHMREHGKTLRKGTVVLPPTLKLVELSCDQCDEKFVNRSKLHMHVKRIHLGVKYNKNIVCEVCGKKCVSYASLRYHQRTHTGERPYSCESCSKRFTDKNQLRIHTRTHTGERPYACAVCGKRFSQKPALNRHYRIHTGAKPYECQFCTKSFSQSNSMKIHVNAVHLKQAPPRKYNKMAKKEILEN